MITAATVLSSDGVKFTVKIYARSEAQAKVAASMETLHASRRTAAQLDEADDYTRVPTNHDDLIAPEEYYPAGGYVGLEPPGVASKAYASEPVPLPAPPKKGKPVLTLIKGGKKS